VLLPHRRVMLGLGECQRYHRHVHSRKMPEQRTCQATKTISDSDGGRNHKSEQREASYMRRPDVIITNIATTLIQWVISTQPG
jgi:hypothetical protein